MKKLKNVQLFENFIKEEVDFSEGLGETLEEAAETWVNQRFTKQICGDESYPDIYASKESIVESHVIFAKSQQERMYSEEELKEICVKYHNRMCLYGNAKTQIWFEQIKKK